MNLMGLQGGQYQPVSCRIKKLGMPADGNFYLVNEKNWISFFHCVLHKRRYQRDQGKMVKEKITCAVLSFITGMRKTG